MPILSIQNTHMKGQKEALMQAFNALRRSLKDTSIAAIQQDKYGESRQLTEIMEQLAALETRTAAVLGGSISPVPAARPSPARADSYPRFYRDGETLYKEGMKQDGKSIYTQKVDRQSFEAITAAVAARGKAKFKPADLVDKLEQPSYQIYIVLKVLQDAGLLRNPERGAYQLDLKAGEIDHVSIWSGLAQSGGY